MSLWEFLDANMCWIVGGLCFIAWMIVEGWGRK